ncbi:MAG: hypothetical protein ACR2RD_15400 [Woeseiaceae bacterium]
MDWAKINDWLQVFGIFAVLVTLVFVAYEIRQTRKIAAMDQLGVFSEMLSQYHGLIAENADVWYRGCSGEELTKAEQVVFEQIVDEFTYLTLIIYARGRIGIFVGGDRLTDNFAANLHRYPVLNDAVRATRNWEFHSRESIELSKVRDGGFVGFRQAVQARLTELQEVEPKPDADLIRCGHL